MSKAHEARVALDQIWGSEASCSHIHAKRAYALLGEIEAAEVRHRAFVVDVAALVRQGHVEGCARRDAIIAIARLLDREVAAMAR